MFTIKNLNKSYGKKQAVKNLSLTVEEGIIYGFLGQNGAGKSTTIKCVAGILKQDSGTIEINGVKNSDLIRFKSLIGYTPDLNNSFERVRGREYIYHFCSIYRVDNIHKKIDKWAKRLGLEKAMDSAIKTYSHGMKQKLNLITCLVIDPKLWILDEPMTGLDPQSTMELIDIMKEFVKGGNSIMFSSHILELVDKICDKIGIIKDGELLSELYLKELTMPLQKIYLDYHIKR